MAINVLITGSDGYIGSALTEHLKSTYFIDRVIGYDLNNGEDILDYDLLVEKLTENNIHVVVHLAALSSVTACNDDVYNAIRVNAIGTNTILKAMKQSGCKHIIYASTSSVYGDSKTIPYTENMLLDPCSVYGSTKLLGEHAIYNYYDINHNKGNYLIYRMFNVVGTSGIPHIDSASNSGYDRLFSALESGNITIYGTNYDTPDGTCFRDYVSLKDVCHAYVLGIKNVIRSNYLRESVNICTNHPTSVKQLVNEWNSLSVSINTHYNSDAYIPYVNVYYGSPRKGDPSIVCGSYDKALKLLDWEPFRKIENIIMDIAVDKKLKHV